MKCLKCGAENAENSQFCLSCGNPLQNNQMPQQQNYNQPMQGQMQYNQQMNYQQPKKSHTGIIVICSIIGVVLLLSVIFTPIMLNIINKAKNGELSDQNSGITEESTGTSTSTKKDKYELADAVTLVDGSKWHVLGYNESGQLILLSDELAKETTGYGKSGAAEDQKYENSLIKDYIDNTYLPALKKSLTKAGGNTKNLTARIISVDEVFEYAQLEFTSNSCYNATAKENSSLLYSGYVCMNGNSLSSECWSHYNEKEKKNARITHMFAMTKNYWTSSNVTDYAECKTVDQSSYSKIEDYGAFYVKVSIFNDDCDYNYNNKSTLTSVKSYEDHGTCYVSFNIYKDNNASKYSSTTSDYSHDYSEEESTSAGIRPVIEIDPSNVK